MSKELLNKLIESVVDGDDAAASDAFDAYIAVALPAFIKEAKEEKEEAKKKPISLKGDDVLVHGKKVGCIKHDAEGSEDIEYYPMEDGGSKKFKELKDLYAHLGKEHKLEEAKDFEDCIKKLPNRLKIKDEKAFEDGKDGKAPKASGKKGKSIIADILAGQKVTRKD